MLKKKSLVILLLLPLFAQAQEMWINEIHYDNSSSDANEFIEVVVEGVPTSTELSKMEVVFYNGDGGGVYLDFNGPHLLSSFDVGTSNSGYSIFSMSIENIQNGAPGGDGMALVNNGTVIEFISYEGVITATDGPAVGMTSTEIGVFENSSTTETQSLQLIGVGNQARLFTWQSPTTNSKGFINPGQTFGDGPPLVKSVFPSDNAIDVEIRTPIKIKFSEPVNTSQSSFAVVCGGGASSAVPIDIGIDAEMINFTLTPVVGNGWANSTNCIVTLTASGITDLDGVVQQQLDGDGNGSAGGDYVFSFNIASDDLPRVISTTPIEGDILLPVGFSVDINFSELVNITSSGVSMSCTDGSNFTGPSASNVSSYTLNPPMVSEGAFCTITLNAVGIRDVTGTSFSQLDGNNDGVGGGNYSFTFAIIEPVAEIHEIQGNGSTSPIKDDFIRTQENVITAITSSGFFMQTPEDVMPIRDDENIDTSNGIFVYTNDATTSLPALNIGDKVSLRGQVIEFRGLTEIILVSSLVVDSTMNDLPIPIEFDATVPSPDPNSANGSCAREFECYEGMLVNVASGIADTGTQKFGEFVAAAHGNRATRGPGIEYSKRNDSQLPPYPTTTYAPDIYNENPELFEVDTNGILPSIENINAGSTFSASGVFTYQFGSYTLLPKVLNITSRREFTQVVSSPTATQISIATQNMYRFFDNQDSVVIDDYDEDPNNFDFAGRVGKASLYFRTIMQSPDIIVLTEIESLAAVQAIATQINIDEPSLFYDSFLVEGQDLGGIDIGFLTKGDISNPLTVSNVTITQLGADELLVYGGTDRKLHDRPPLLLNATVSKGGFTSQINVLGVHMRSRSGITESDRRRIRNKHFEQSISVANMVQDLQSPVVPLVVIGDFNDFEFSDGYVDVIGEIKGVVEPVKNLFSSNGNSVVNPTLTNAVDVLPAEKKYSFIFRGATQVLDHALVNEPGLAMLDINSVVFTRGNSESSYNLESDYMQPFGMSDHDGLLIYLDLNTVLETIFLNGFEQ